MAIAFDNVLHTGVQGSGTSYSRSFTLSGSDRFLFAWGFSTHATDFSSVTYNGVALTKAGEITIAGFDIEAHYLLAPATGTNNLVWNSSSSTTFVTCATSYTGASQSFTPNTATNTGTGTTVSGSITTGSNNSWVVSATRSSDPDASGTNWTRRTNVGFGHEMAIADTNAAISPAGSTSISVGINTSYSWGLYMLEIEEAGGGGGANTTNFFAYF